MLCFKAFAPASLAFVLLAMAAPPSGAQQVYRVTGPDGKVTFTDKLPPASGGASAATASTGPAGSAGAGLPYELRQVASRYPVVLYTSPDCGPCAAARTLLLQRGVPFAERTITTREDSDSLQKISGDSGLPFGTIGSQHLQGFSDAEWTQYLDAAGYPKQSQLPPNFRPAAATPLVAVKRTAPEAPPGAAASAARAPGAAEAPRAPARTPSNPGGITF